LNFWNRKEVAIPGFFRQRTEMDLQKIVNASRESDRFGLSKSLYQVFRRVTGGSRADRPQASRPT
jgi:hypothetical protein